MAKSNVSLAVYYVYVLFRWDGVPFYIGKGKKDRIAAHLSPARLNKKSHKNNIIKKTITLVGEVPSVKIRSNLTEAKAHQIEIALIAAIGRAPSGPLVNGTDGGEGMSNPSPETKAKLRLRMSSERARQMQSMLSYSPATRAKMSASHKGMMFSQEHKEKMSIYAQNRSPKHKQRLAAAASSDNLSPERRQRMSIAAKKRWDLPIYMQVREANRNRSPETKAKMSASALRRWQNDQTYREKILSHLERLNAPRRKAKPTTE